MTPMGMGPSSPWDHFCNDLHKNIVITSSSCVILRVRVIEKKLSAVTEPFSESSEYLSVDGVISLLLGHNRLQHPCSLPTFKTVTNSKRGRAQFTRWNVATARLPISLILADTFRETDWTAQTRYEKKKCKQFITSHGIINWQTTVLTGTLFDS